MITLTETAAKKIIDNLTKRGKGLGIRIGVKTTGCSGLAYVLEYVDHTPTDSGQFMNESYGAKVWVDGKSAPYVSGLVVDWTREGLNEGFNFQNPNEKDRCGCGTSFRI